MMPQSPSKWAPWYFTQFSQLPSAALLYFPESHQQSEISSLSKVIWVLGKARSHRTPNLGCRGAESPGWLDVSPKNSAGDVMHERARCCDEPANHPLPTAVAFWIIWIVSSEKCSRLMQIVWRSVALHISHFECDSHTVRMLTQQHLPPPLTSTVKLSLFTHVHSSPLSLAARWHRCCINCSCYISNGWALLGQTLSVRNPVPHFFNGCGFN